MSENHPGTKYDTYASGSAAPASFFSPEPYPEPEPLKPEPGSLSITEGGCVAVRVVEMPPTADTSLSVYVRPANRLSGEQ